MSAGRAAVAVVSREQHKGARGTALEAGWSGERLANSMLAWTHSGFSVDLTAKIPASSAKTPLSLAGYIARLPLSLKKMLVEEHADSVLYRFRVQGILPTLPTSRVLPTRVRIVREKHPLEGRTLDVNPPSGCRFRTRCPLAVDICAKVEPPL
jgi:hypothetical protein